MHATVTQAANFVLERVQISKSRAEEAMSAACKELGLKSPPELSCYAHADGSFKIGLSRKNGGCHYIPHDFETEEGAYLVPWMKETANSSHKIIAHLTHGERHKGEWVEKKEELPQELVDFLNCLLKLGFGFTVYEKVIGGLGATTETGEAIENYSTGWGYITFSPFGP